MQTTRNIFAVAVLVVIAQVSCAPKEADTPTTKSPVKVGYLPLSAAIPLFVAVERGLFEAADVEVVLEKYQNGAQMAEDVIRGRIDAASPGPADVYLRNEASGPDRFRIYLQTAYTPANYIYSLLVREDSGIRSAADLRGRRMAVFPGTTNSLLCGLALSRAVGLEPGKDISISGVAPQLQIDTLANGDYDVLCPLEPTGTIAASRQGLQQIDRGQVEREVVNPLYITIHALSAASLETKGRELSRFVNAMHEAVDLIRQDEPAARRVLPLYTLLTEVQAQSTPLGDLVRPEEADIAKFQELIDLLESEGDIPDAPEASTLYYKRAE